jgi:hypothetical protein
MRKGKKKHVFGLKKRLRHIFWGLGLDDAPSLQRSVGDTKHLSLMKGVGMPSTWAQVGAEPVRGTRRAQHLGSGWRLSPLEVLDTPSIWAQISAQIRCFYPGLKKKLKIWIWCRKVKKEILICQVSILNLCLLSLVKS